MKVAWYWLFIGIPVVLANTVTPSDDNVAPAGLSLESEMNARHPKFIGLLKDIFSTIEQGAQDVDKFLKDIFTPFLGTEPPPPVPGTNKLINGPLLTFLAVKDDRVFDVYYCAKGDSCFSDPNFKAVADARNANGTHIYYAGPDNSLTDVLPSDYKIRNLNNFPDNTNLDLLLLSPISKISIRNV